MSLSVYLHEVKRTEIYEDNITHNLACMAEEAGLWKPLWRPEEVGLFKAEQMIAPLENGLEKLLEDPEKFKKLNPINGWGDYTGLVRFVRDYLAACKENPNAEISVDR